VIEYLLSTAAADYPRWEGSPKRSLVMCTQQRSGSTLLGEAIHFAGELGCPLEYFHTGFRPAFEARWQTSGLQDYARKLHSLRTDPSGTFSIKLFWRDAMDFADEATQGGLAALRTSSPASAPADAYRCLLDLLTPILPDPIWVFLTRRHSLRQAVSNFVAWRTDAWRNLPGQDWPRLGEVEYDHDAIRSFLRRILVHNAHWQRFFDENHIRPVTIVYEDLERDYPGTLRAFLAAIGRADAPVTPPRLVKQANAASEALIERFCCAFART
jgi:LPS sulfotransferase NodH